MGASSIDSQGIARMSEATKGKCFRILWIEDEHLPWVGKRIARKVAECLSRPEEEVILKQVRSKDDAEKELGLNQGSKASQPDPDLILLDINLLHDSKEGGIDAGLLLYESMIVPPPDSKPRFMPHKVVILTAAATYHDRAFRIFLASFSAGTDSQDAEKIFMASAGKKEVPKSLKQFEDFMFICKEGVRLTEEVLTDIGNAAKNAERKAKEASRASEK